MNLELHEFVFKMHSSLSNLPSPFGHTDKETSLFCVPDGFDYHRPVKMGENIILGSTSSLALIKVAGVCLTMSPHGGT